MKYIYLLFISLIASSYSVAQKSSTPEFISEELDTYIEQAMKDWNVPGCAVAIVKDGKVILAKGYGVKETGKKKKVDKHTLFMIASNTKAFVGTSLAMLENEGKCNLDDKLTKWVPDFKMYHSKYTDEVSINDVLSHRLGLRTFQGDFMYFYSNLSKDEVYQKFSLVKPENEFRAKYGYCNAGYFWAGETIQAISGVTWDKYVQTNILRPLKMKDTKMLSEGISKYKNVASAHTLQNHVLTAFPHTNIDVIGPAASMCASIEDMSHWLIAQTDSGRYKGNQVIPYEVIKNTRYPRTFNSRAGHSFNKTHYSLYGLGWGMRDYEGKEVISHTGGILGFVTAVALVPEENLGVVILTNTDENWMYEALQWEIIDAYLELPKRNYSKRYVDYFNFVQKKNKAKNQILMDSVKLSKGHALGNKAFVGKYKSEVYGHLEIIQEGDDLQIVFEHHPDLKASLEHMTDDRFLCTYYPSRMGMHIFPFDIESNKVKGFTLEVADRLEYTSYYFVKQ